MTDISPLVAFLAGLLSFLSPCVLPLVPGYVSLMSGVSVERLRQGGSGGTGAVLIHSLLFVLGLSTVFVAMGTSASAVGQFLRAHLPVLVRFAGVLIILLGIFMLGLLRIPALYRVARFQSNLRPGKLGAFLLGLSFAFCWTPCIGPILAAILLLAATKATIAQGVFLLSLYSLGLGVPFLLTAVGINSFLNFYQGLRRYLNWVERAAGVLLIGVGVLLVANQFNWLASQFGFLNRFSPEALLAASPAARPAGDAAGPETPVEVLAEFTLRDVSGREVSSASFRGKVLLLDYWATWCAPCEKEMPEFQKMQDRYGDQGLVVVGIAMDTDPADVERFAKRLGIGYTLLMGTLEVQEKLGIQGLPTTFVVDREGRIRKKVIGFEYPEEFEKTVRELL